MSQPIRLVVIDDHPLMREGIVNVLSSAADLEVVGEGCSANDAVALSAQLTPDVLLLDVSIPGGGIEAARRLAAVHPGVRVVMLTVAEDEDTVTAALQSGACGYILKGISGPELVATIKRAHAGEPYISPHLAARLLAQKSPTAGGQNATDGRMLTVREEQILSRVVQGQSYTEIGRELSLAEGAVKSEMSDVLRKLAAHSGRR